VETKANDCILADGNMGAETALKFGEGFTATGFCVAQPASSRHRIVMVT
jgi:hypothetical protein